MASYANVIVDISHEKLDKTFQYLIPEQLNDMVQPGVEVDILFGNRRMTGYVVEVTDVCEFEESRIKPIIGIKKGSVRIESRLISLAAWMKRNYGSTMNQALKTVIPIKKQIKSIEKKTIRLVISEPKARELLLSYRKKHYTAKERLLKALLEDGLDDYRLAIQKLHISSSVIKGLEKDKIISIESESVYRNPIANIKQQKVHTRLNEEQMNVVEHVQRDWDNHLHKVYLLKGVTGSGKTEVYMELISRVLKQGKEAIVLIPEIALTYQTVMRFYSRFGNLVSIMNSRLSHGEKYDQFMRAQAGDIRIMIGPRSALFTPFQNLGIIIIDEEHETSYKSEVVPRYHAREVAIERAKNANATVILGSATPSLDSTYRARKGIYTQLELTQRVDSRPLPVCEVVDLRQELREGNRSILSLRLQELMEDRLQKKQQIMLFLNRRGVAGFCSCRACGKVIKCPHCDVSLSQHVNGKMICHYCGYEEAVHTTCPSCGSKYIAGFKAGTQKIEQIVKEQFPKARILRMDYDTTREKNSYETILERFANQEADILIGTQMIVKGHDFSNVTLVGILAADMSLHVGNFHAAERTFQLLTQAAGRAGRGNLPGEVIIQTYDPEHFAIHAAKEQDYDTFYEQEIAYREMLLYPPIWNMLLIMCISEKQQELQQGMELLSDKISDILGNLLQKVQMVGPADATLSKINDRYRKVIYLKTEEYNTLVQIKDAIEVYIKDNKQYQNIMVYFDFNPEINF